MTDNRHGAPLDVENVRIEIAAAVAHIMEHYFEKTGVLYDVQGIWRIAESGKPQAGMSVKTSTIKNAS